MTTIHVSRPLANIISYDGTAIAGQATPDSVLENITQILSLQDKDVRIQLLKEYYCLISINFTTAREVMGVLCAHISTNLVNKGFPQDGLSWIDKAISHDERRLIFYYYKALIVLSLGRHAEVISLAGHLKHIKPSLIDFDEELYEATLNLAPTSAKRQQNNAVLQSISSEQKVDVSIAQASRNPVEPDQAIYLFACCYNELRMLHFFLEYYSNHVGVTKFFIYDGGSSDGSVELMKKYDVQILEERHETLDDRLLMNFRNNYYKNYRESCDWVIVCDVDEFLYHPNIKSRLRELSAEGVTLPRVDGYNMISLDWPDPSSDAFLPFLAPYGISDNQNCAKSLVFNPKIDINYSIGCHAAHPAGDVVRSSQVEFKNLHYAQIAYSHVILKSNAQKNRLSDWNKHSKAGFHYNFNADLKLEDYMKRYKSAKRVV